MQLDIQDEEEVLARGATIDVAKATGMVCTRVPHENAPGKRVTKVWQVSATTNALLGLADLHGARPGRANYLLGSMEGGCAAQN